MFDFNRDEGGEGLNGNKVWKNLELVSEFPPSKSLKSFGHSMILFFQVGTALIWFIYSQICDTRMKRWNEAREPNSIKKIF